MLPYARPGIVAGGFLALGRALGETMAVTMLIGNRATIENPIFGGGDSIASRLANQYMEADTRLFRSVLVELALILLVVTLFINSLARYLLARFSQRKPLLPSWLWPRPAAAPGRPSAGRRRPRPARPRPGNSRAASTGWLSAQAVDKLMTGVLFSCVAFTMAMLVVILAYLLVNGVGALNWEFFTELPVSPTVESGGGLANAIVGTITVVGWATAFAVPVGLLAAIYLAEYRAGPLAKTLRFVSEQLGGVPSIVMGLFAAGLFAFVAESWERRFGERPRFYGWSGIFALAVMMVPIVLRAAEEALKLVPVSLRSASYALGASHAQTVLRVTVPGGAAGDHHGGLPLRRPHRRRDGPAAADGGVQQLLARVARRLHADVAAVHLQVRDGAVGELEPPGVGGGVPAHGHGAGAELRHPPGDRPRVVQASRAD